MTLLFYDGFDSANVNSLLRGWTVVTGTGGFVFADRYGDANGVQLRMTTSTHAVQRILSPAISSGVVGLAYSRSFGPTDSTSIFSLMDGTTQHLTIGRVGEHRIQAMRGTWTGGAIIGSTTKYRTFLTKWYFIEIEFSIADAGGYCRVYLDGEQIINFTGDTRNAGNASIDRVQLFNSSGIAANDYDDVYVLDTSGSANNSRLGEQKTITLRPNAAGTYTGWSPSSGANYTCVDEQFSDGDGSFVQRANAFGTLLDTYNLQDLSVAGTYSVAAITEVLYARWLTSVSHVAPVIRTNSTDLVGTLRTLTSSYVLHWWLLERNPVTAAAWSFSDINNLQAGVNYP